MSAPFNWLIAGNLIADRLRQAVPGFADVRTAGGLDAAIEQTPRTPAAWVIWDGDTPGPGTGEYIEHLMRQRWLVVLIVRDEQGFEVGSGVLDRAGVLLAQTLDALSGWRPSADHGRLRRVVAPSANVAGGLGYFPLVFETAVHQMAPEGV